MHNDKGEIKEVEWRNLGVDQKAIWGCVEITFKQADGDFYMSLKFRGWSHLGTYK
jgi:hypothetical protein